MDQQPVNLDGFAVEDPSLGLVAFGSPADPAPSLVVAGGRVVELDGRPEAQFDVVDAFIAGSGGDCGGGCGPVIGRGDVAGGAGPGHRWAVAYGLIVLDCDGRTTPL
jgi:hypothetical protein